MKSDLTAFDGIPGLYYPRKANTYTFKTKKEEYGPSDVTSSDRLPNEAGPFFQSLGILLLT